MNKWYVENGEQGDIGEKHDAENFADELADLAAAGAFAFLHCCISS